MTSIDPRAAFSHGLRFVHQDLGLVNSLSVADNLAFPDAFGGSRSLAPLRSRRLRGNARAALERLSLEIDPFATVGGLSRTDQIMVAIARALQSETVDPTEQLVILDEPTASLPAGSVERVLEAVDHIRQSGGTVIYVTHRIDEVIRIANDVVVLRDGSVVAHRELGGMDAAGIANVIVGARLTRTGRDLAHELGEVALRVSGLSGRRIHDLDFDVHAGEIFGVAGLAGCGRSELARIVGGAQQPEAGSISVGGVTVDARSSRDALDAGIAFVPPERARLGCIPDMSLRHNISLSDLSLDPPFC